MGVGAARHDRAKAQAWLALRLAIAAQGLGCEALPDGATVRIDDRTVYEPDALVRCGPSSQAMRSRGTTRSSWSRSSHPRVGESTPA